jgi:hypothetical protein
MPTDDVVLSYYDSGLSTALSPPKLQSWHEVSFEPECMVVGDTWAYILSQTRR